MTEIKVQSLKVERGDSFILHFRDSGFETSLVIDSGYSRGRYKIFRNALDGLFKETESDVCMLLTHIDSDHIMGFKKLVEDTSFHLFSRISRFYYNTFDCIKSMWPEEINNIMQQCPGIVTNLESADRICLDRETSYLQAKKLEEYLAEKNVTVVTGLFAGKKLCLGEHVQAVVLTPTADSAQDYKTWLLKHDEQDNLYTAHRSTDYSYSLDALLSRKFTEDYGEVNASSVNLLIEAYGRKLLFLGDAPPRHVVQSLRVLGFSEETPLYADFVKLSHHGSRKSTSPELLGLIRSGRFLISGNGTPGHPDKECLARIIAAQDCPALCFNYDISSKIFSSKEMNSGRFTVECSTEWEV